MLNIRKECFAFISHKQLSNSPTLKLLLILKQKLNILCINEENIGMTATETITSNARTLGADPLVKYKKAKRKRATAWK